MTFEDEPHDEKGPDHHRDVSARRPSGAVDHQVARAELATNAGEAGELAGLPPVRGRLRPGDLLIYRTDGPSRRHVAMVVGRGRMVEALGRGIPVRSTSIRGGWLGAVRPGAGR